jgi:hypothetical protein
MLVIDGHGRALGYHLDSASCAEIALAEQMLDTIRVRRGRGRPKQRPKRERPVVARKDDYRQRYTVERTCAWLGAFRRLRIRWERLAHLYRSFFTIALVVSASVA